MEKRSIKEWIVRTCILLAGLTIAHLGVTLFLLILPAEIPLFTRVLMLVTGCVILAFGMTIVIKSDAGPSCAWHWWGLSQVFSSGQ